MLLIRLMLALVIGRTMVGRSLLMPPPAGSDGEPDGEPGPETPDADAAQGANAADAVNEGADGAVAEPEAAEPNDGRKDRAPWLVRMSIAAAPLVGLLFFIVAVAALVDQNTDWMMPIGGGVEGDWPLAVLLISIGIWAVWLLWQVPRWQAAAWRQSMKLEEREIFDIENSSRATLGQILSGVAVLAGLIFAWQQLGNTSQNLFVSQEGQITDRFTRAVGQLGDDDLTIRLGGIYALERIARDSERDHETVMEILAAFARQRSAAEEQAAAAPGTPGAAPVDGTGGEVSLTSVRAIPLDIDVVLKVISRRDSTRDGAGCIDLSDINLAGAQLGDSSLNLTNVCLRGADLRDSQLSGVDFAGADLAGADFTGAILIGANLSGADLTGAIFSGANLDQANLAGAQLTSANFARANLSLANLSSANLTGANLQTPGLQGTILRDAILNRTDFTGAVLATADLQGANMLGAVLDGATLMGVDLRGVTNLTPEQLDAASFDGTTQLPEGIAATPDF